MEAPKPFICCEQVRLALIRVLQTYEADEVDDDIVVKESITRTGRKMYILIAANGAEQPVKRGLVGVAGPRSYCGAGTWVLREGEALRLLQKAGWAIA